MKFSFQPLPAETIPRPLVPLTFPDLPSWKLLGLVDSGAVGTRISSEVAEALNMDLTDAEVKSFRVAGHDYHCRSTIVTIAVGRHAPRPMRVDFVDGWNHDHALLGIKGFFEEFTVRINGLSKEFSITPSRHPAWAEHGQQAPE
jgi:hypothetical protein